MAAPEWRILLQLLKQIAIPRGRSATGLFSLEGYRSMERALRNDAPIREVLVSRKFAEADTSRETSILAEVSRRGVPLRIAPDEDFAELNAGRGIGEVFAVMPIPEEPDWECFVQPQGRCLLMVGWNLGDPGNTGAVIRSALASGCSGFLAVGTTDPWHPKSVRTSMGSLFALPILKVGDDDAWLENLHQRNFETVATVCRDAEMLPDLKLTGLRTALVLGSEAFGLPDALAMRMQRRVTIPMPEGVDSYSINAAAAVLAYSLMQKSFE
ncbi:RNA methyltransferase [Kiritimatiellaeota bacterium B1221]|nr:RNA methyltransferase [Kiritimatiellaeota bacterium B1221]